MSLNITAKLTATFTHQRQQFVQAAQAAQARKAANPPAPIDTFRPMTRLAIGAVATTAGLTPAMALMATHGPVGGLTAMGSLAGAVTSAVAFKANSNPGEALSRGAKAGAIAGAATGLVLAATMAGATPVSRLAVLAGNAAFGALAGTVTSAVQKALH